MVLPKVDIEVLCDGHVLPALNRLKPFSSDYYKSCGRTDVVVVRLFSDVDASLNYSL